MAHAVGIPDPAHVVRLPDVSRTYRRVNVLVPVLRGVMLDVDPGEWLAILGPSGSGKSTISAVESDMRAAHNLNTAQADDFLVINPTTVVQAEKQSSTDFTRLITAIAAFSLIVAGIGVANVMLVAVRERTREIAVRRALGARRRDIIVQFLTEATVLSAVGGAIGVLLGLGFAYLLPSISSQQTQVSYWAALLAFVASALVGIVVGVGPANQAAALEPASALRYE